MPPCRAAPSALVVDQSDPPRSFVIFSLLVTILRGFFIQKNAKTAIFRLMNLASISIIILGACEYLKEHRHLFQCKNKTDGIGLLAPAKFPALHHTFSRAEKDGGYRLEETQAVSKISFGLVWEAIQASLESLCRKHTSFSALMFPSPLKKLPAFFYGRKRAIGKTRLMVSHRIRQILVEFGVKFLMLFLQPQKLLVFLTGNHYQFSFFCKIFRNGNCLHIFILTHSLAKSTSSHNMLSYIPL